MVRWCQLRGGKPGYNNLNAFLTGALDAMVTAQTAALVAESMGLGICFLGSTLWEPKLLADALSLPEGVHVVTSIMMGWPAEDPPCRSRLPEHASIHYERYSPMADAEILSHYESREVEGWNRYIGLYGSSWKEKLDSHQLENLAQVYTCLKYSGADFRLWSRRFLESLSMQGFGANDAMDGDDEPCRHCGALSHCLDPRRLLAMPCS